MHGKHVDQIGIGRHKRHQQAESYEARPDDGNHEVRLRLDRPSVPEEADREEESAKTHDV